MLQILVENGVIQSFRSPVQITASASATPIVCLDGFDQHP
jgi:hypothetical protein